MALIFTLLLPKIGMYNIPNVKTILNNFSTIIVVNTSLSLDHFVLK